MKSTAFAIAALCLVAAVHSMPARADHKDALEPKDDLKTDSTYGLGYAYPGLGYYGYSSYPAYGYGYGLNYAYGYPSYYYSAGYPAYYI